MYEYYCKLRDKKGCKDSDVAKATGISRSTFTDWKSGRSKPKNDKLQKIADYFGVSLEYLLTGEETKEESKENEFKAKDNMERRLLLLCRKAGEASLEDKEMVLKTFESTIDLYLRAKGIIKE